MQNERMRTHLDFKESGFMYALAGGMILFIIAQSLFFVIKSWKHGKELGIKKETMKNTIISSFLFTLAPALSILVTVIALANALGIVLPWIRLSVIGNLAYETVAAENSLSVVGGSLSNEVTDPQIFNTISWAMTIGAVFPLVFLPLVCKKLQKKIGSSINKNAETQKLGDILSAAAFIGIIAAFIARAINGCTVAEEEVLDKAGQAVTQSIVKESAGVLSILTLLAAVVFMIIFSTLCSKVKVLAKFEPFAMPLAMFAAMGCTILFSNVLPDDFAGFTWYAVGEVLK